MNMEKQNFTHLYADGVHSRKQLHNLLEAAGFTVTENTFRNLEMKEDGKYADVTFRMTEGNGLTGLSERDAKESVFDRVFQRLANVLGQRFLSDIEVTDRNPLTEGSRKGIAYVKARIAGIPMATKEFGGQLFNSYVQGIMTEKDIAARLYYPDMLKMHNELHREALYAASLQKKNGTTSADAETTRFIYVHQQVHKDQLRALLKDAGLQVTPETFRQFKPDANGRYGQFGIRVTGGKAVCLSPEETAAHEHLPFRNHLYELVGPRVISHVKVAEQPAPDNAMAFQPAAIVSARIHGVPMAPVPIGQTLLNGYKRGVFTPTDLATGVYQDALIDSRRQVHIQADCGSRWTNGVRTVYYGGYTSDGFCYKDLTAFDEKDGVCFISQANLQDYEADLKEGRDIDINQYGDTYEELVAYARDLSLRNPEKVARHAVEQATWQSAFTELEEFHNHCEPEDILTLDEEIVDKFDRYVEEHGKQPNYAEVFIEYKDDRASQRDMVALNPEAGEAADEEVAFTFSNFDAFKRLTSEDSGEDFVIREIYAYHAGSMEGQKHTFDDAHIHDELDETIRQAEQAEERVIEVDMDMTPQQLKDVLAKEGIKLLDVLPGMDEPLPLNKDNGNVAHVYLRVVYDGVIDWADEYMYRDAMQDDPNLKIESLAAMVRLQQGVADSTAKEIPWYEDLSRISDVRIYRNPLNKSSLEFRLRCTIDGVQQMGRIIHPQMVEDLANGADRTEMAAKVFAREMTLNNPQSQQKTLTR